MVPNGISVSILRYHYVFFFLFHWALACPSIFSYLPPTLSIFSLPTLEDLFLLPLFILSWVFPFFLPLIVLEWRSFLASYPPPFSIADLTSLSFALLSILLHILLCSSLLILLCVKCKFVGVVNEEELTKIRSEFEETDIIFPKNSCRIPALWRQKWITSFLVSYVLHSGTNACVVMVERNVNISVPEHTASRRTETCTTARHLSLPWARRIHSTPSQAINLRFLLTIYSCIWRSGDRAWW